MSLDCLRPTSFVGVFVSKLDSHTLDYINNCGIWLTNNPNFHRSVRCFYVRLPESGIFGRKTVESIAFWALFVQLKQSLRTDRRITWPFRFRFVMLVVVCHRICHSVTALFTLNGNPFAKYLSKILSERSPYAKASVRPTKSVRIHSKILIISGDSDRENYTHTHKNRGL